MNTEKNDKSYYCRLGNPSLFLFDVETFDV